MTADRAPPTLSSWLEAAWSRPSQERSVGVEGAQVSYLDWGAPKAGATPGTGLVFVHGFLAHARWWDHIAPHFADRYHVIAPDLTGMGNSDNRPDYCRRQYAREIIAALRDAGIARATLVAHSFGSLSCLYAAMIAPELIERVIVIDVHIFRTEEEHLPDTVQPEKRYPDRATALARYRLKPEGRRPVPEIVDYVARHSLRQVGNEWSWKFDPKVFTSVNSNGMRDEVRGLTAPTDYVHAGNSEMIGDTEVAAFLANMPGCGRPVTIPLSGHHIMLEQPVALVSALDGLLANPR